jgi:hypothetical protein
VLLLEFHLLMHEIHVPAHSEASLNLVSHKFPIKPRKLHNHFFCLFIFAECNRTYHGNVGTTYHMELHRPKEDKLPYVCLITFAAAGGANGDIVQVSVVVVGDKFSG